MKRKVCVFDVPFFFFNFTPLPHFSPVCLCVSIAYTSSIRPPLLFFCNFVCLFFFFGALFHCVTFRKKKSVTPQVCCIFFFSQFYIFSKLYAFLLCRKWHTILTHMYVY
ncbi:hypothetical protein, unlikely [Trypanosoma brucei gambiense DAL972]|uniref:Uncharacterized protein n=1 Tax=Trypanosoma brucei gambiense (strain MHOM/CI/86/DAL972) TaxID=679716 RepID=C9ZQ66_TRYB9|nr:hypothetical protein, unlikely [Trypanosoma brucei gambiense DAL972]CBH11546.1 hypothetical protein, unlikely [Trypanosoma brucei gambiense DAL972]|eukprot:XP_011773831.1 hypothetical protein, unlikely [Trypanosoma brucei gambiense DAL972]